MKCLFFFLSCHNTIRRFIPKRLTNNGYIVPIPRAPLLRTRRHTIFYFPIAAGLCIHIVTLTTPLKPIPSSGFYFPFAAMLGSRAENGLFITATLVCNVINGWAATIVVSLLVIYDATTANLSFRTITLTTAVRPGTPSGFYFPFTAMLGSPRTVNDSVTTKLVCRVKTDFIAATNGWSFLRCVKSASTTEVFVNIREQLLTRLRFLS